MPKKPIINYTSREFETIRNDLLAYARRYYSETYKDFSEASFGSLMIDTVAYIGDILSFYLDYQANESYLSTAVEYNNVLSLSKQLGYKFQPNPSSFGILNCYIQVPADSLGTGLNEDYIPILKRDSKFYSDTRNIYTLLEDINFADPGNQIVVAQQDSSTGQPTSYAIRASGQIISGELAIQEIEIGAFQKFLRLELDGSNISEVVSVIDDKGNEYVEVDYLSQNTVYLPIINRGDNTETVPNILKPITVVRRFIVDQEEDKTFIQFGFGSDESPVELADPSKVILQTHGRKYITDTSFDPSNLIATDSLGVAPSNGVLTVIYRVNTDESVNSAVGSVTKILSAEIEFPSDEDLSNDIMSFVRNSLEITNEEPILGSIAPPTSEEIKFRALSTYASQNRAVTKEDFINLVYRMPAQFGAIKRASISQDSDSFNGRNLNLYVASVDTNGRLLLTNDTIKSNLKIWMQQHIMINDTIDILNARVVNLGIDFVVSSFPGSNKYDLLDTASTQLAAILSHTEKDIGEPFRITEVYEILKTVPDLLDVVSVDIHVKTGGAYTGDFFSILDNKTADGRYIKAPEDVIFEIRFPENDIRGTIK